MAEDVGALKVSLALDSANFTQSMASIDRNLRAMGQEMASVRARGSDWGNSLQGLTSKQENLTRILDGQEIKVRRLRDAYEASKAATGANSVETERLAVALNRATAEYNRTETELAQITAALQRQADELRLSQNNWTRFGETLTTIGATMQVVGDKMTSVGKSLTTKVTAPIVALGTISAKVGSDFEASMSKVGAISGSTGKDLQSLEDKARDLGATTQFSASEAADALSYMAMAGWRTGDMLSGIDGVMNLAAASGEDLAMVSDIVTDALTAFGLAAEDSGRFADVLAAASSSANTDVAMMGKSFEYVAPVAGSLGFTIEDVSVAIGLMANSGIKADKAGTALRTMMTNLAKPVGGMSDEMDRLGISLTDSEDNMKTFDTIIQELRSSFANLSEAEQAASAATIFGKEAMSGALAIINASSADYDKLTVAINGSEGAAKKMADIMTDNLQGRLKEMKSAIEEAAISIYKNLQPALEVVVKTVKSLVDGFNKLSPATQNTIILIAGIAAAVGPVLVVLGVLISSIGSVVTALGVLSAGMAVARTGILSTSVAVNVLGASIKVLLGPVGWIIGAMGLLVAGTIAIVAWFNKSTKESKRLNAETEKLGESTSALNGAVNDSSVAYEQNQISIKASARANSDLIAKIEELSEKENKSAAEKALLQSNVDMLNTSMEGLNLSYSEESNALSMSSEQLQTRLQLIKDQEELQAGQERFLEISKEQAEVDMKLQETNELRADWNQKLEEGSVKAKAHKEALAELDEQEILLTETNVRLAEQQKTTEVQVTTSIEAITAATESGATAQRIAVDELSESQSHAIKGMMTTWEEYKNAATNMFDTLSEKSTVTIGEMTKNLEENQRVIANWSENIAILATRGIDEGLLDTLREAGPESAGHVNALVKASDAELEKLSVAFAKGGDVATGALGKSLGIEESGVLDSVAHLVTGTENSLKKNVEEANFAGIGKAVPEGLAKGIKDGSKGAENASKKMSDDTTKASKNALGVQSPSRVFKDIGTNITEGLVLGISGGSQAVITSVLDMFKKLKIDSDNSFKDIVMSYDLSVKEIEKTLMKLPIVMQDVMKNTLDKLKIGVAPITETMKKMEKDLTNTFDSTPSQFQSIGKEVMAGFDRGLKNGEAQVLATARRIAESVARTTKKALDINSPSGVFMDIGKDTGQGFEIGMENSISSIRQAARKMVNAAVPDVGGIRTPIYPSWGGQSTSPSNTSNVVNHYKVTIDAKNVRDFNSVVEFMSELPQQMRKR